MARVWIPADRFIALLEDANVTKTSLSDVGRRRVEELYSGRQECLSLEAADRILTHLDLIYLLHLPKEAGGLGDLYFETDPYVPSWVGRKRRQLKAMPRPRKYNTVEERREANRLNTARAAAKRRTPCEGCGELSHGTRCRSCYLKVEAAHGTISRYAGNRKCRCGLCKAASSAYHRDRRRRMSEAYLDAQAAA